MRGGSQNRNYIKNQYIPRLTKENMSIYSSVNREIYVHVAGAGVMGRAPTICNRGIYITIFVGYV
jgi:hypothetical protein